MYSEFHSFSRIAPFLAGLGRTTNLYIVEGGIKLTSSPVPPQHALSLQGELASADRQAAAFAGGDSDDPAALTIKVSGSRFIAGTQHFISMVMPVNGADQLVRFIYTTQASATASAIATGITNTIKSVIDNGTTPMPTGGAVDCTDPSASATELADAATAVFGAATNVAASGDTVTLTVGADGADGNNYSIMTYIGATLPSPIISVNSLLQPNYPGARLAGAIRNSDYKEQPQIQPILCDNILADLDQRLTGIKPMFDVEFVENQSAFAMADVSGASNLGFTATRDIVSLAGRTLSKAGLILVEQAYQTGQVNLYVMPTVTAVGGIQRTFAKGTDSALKGSFALVPDSAGHVGHISVFREV